MKYGSRDPIAQALTASWAGKGLSINADDWPGVVAAAGEWRVIVPRNASEYRLQRRSPHKGGRWQPVYGVCAPPALWAAAVARVAPCLAGAVSALPSDPLDAVSRLASAHGVTVDEVQRRRYWGDPAYSGVLKTDANMRAVRDRTGALYAVQWIAPADYEAARPVRWVTQGVNGSWPVLVDALAQKTGFVGEPRNDRGAVRARLAALFDGLPELAAEGPWPQVKVSAVRPRRPRRSVLAPSAAKDHG